LLQELLDGSASESHGVARVRSGLWTDFQV